MNNTSVNQPQPSNIEDESTLRPNFDPYSHLGGQQGREAHRVTEGDHANYIGGPGSGSYGYGAGGHGYSGPEDRGMNQHEPDQNPAQQPKAHG